jgi:hypothetical protein
VICWISAVVTEGAAAPVCVWLSSARVTSAKIANGAAQCATRCGVAGAACENIAEMWSARKTTSARIVNDGCTKGGFFSVEGDVCGLGWNHLYSVDAPESRKCVKGDPKNCAARGIR